MKRGKINTKNNNNYSDDYESILSDIVLDQQKMHSITKRSRSITCDIDHLESYRDLILTIIQCNEDRLERYKKIRSQVLKVLKDCGYQNQISQISGNNFMLYIKGRSNFNIYIDICVFELNINMRDNINSNRRQNNQRIIGNAIDRMKNILDHDKTAHYIIYCKHQFDENIVRKYIKTNGGILSNSIDDLKRIMMFC